MAIPDGKPATDFSAMNREWVRAVAKEAAEGGGGGGGGGIPAPANPSDGDVLTYSSADDEWVAAAPGGGGGGSTFDILIDYDVDPDTDHFQTVATVADIVAAYNNDEKMLTCNDLMAISVMLYETDGPDSNMYWSLMITCIAPPADLNDSNAYITTFVAEVLQSDASTSKFVFKYDDDMTWRFSATPLT